MLKTPNSISRLALISVAAFTTAAGAETIDVTIDSALPWVGFINVFEQPAVPGPGPGPYVEGVFLGGDIAGVPASFSGGVLSLTPNSLLGGAPGSGSPWWTEDGQGGFAPNRLLETNVYVDSVLGGPAMSGKTVRFTGTTVASSLVAPYTAYAWIREFQPGYAVQLQQVAVPLLAGQAFEMTLDSTFGNPVQFGIAMFGPNADPAALSGLGSVSVSAVPEPTTPAMMLLGALAIGAWMRRRRG